MIIRTLCLLLLFTVASCGDSDRQSPEVFAGQAMTISYRVLIGKKLSWQEKRVVKQTIARTFEEIDAVYNKWNPASVISQLNRSSAFQKNPIPSDLEAFLLATGKLVALSDGKFDPSIESAQKVWKEYLVQGTVPSEEIIASLKSSVGWKQVHVDNGFFWKESDALQLDLGGVAKGYAIDLIMERLSALGYDNLYVEWGGEMRTSGKHPEGRPWRIVVSRDESRDLTKALAIVDMDNNAVASSGDYLQNWKARGNTYCHIIDPATCRPLLSSPTSISAATIIAKDCMTADALATAAMLFATPEEASQWLLAIRDHVPELQFWIASQEQVSKMEAAVHSGLDTEISQDKEFLLLPSS